MSNLTQEKPNILYNIKQALIDMREKTTALAGFLNSQCFRFKTKNAPDFSEMEQAYLKNAKIIFCTLSVSGRKTLQNFIVENHLNIDTLIIDEAGQAVEAETLIPFFYNPKKCLLAGDTKQLPATVFSTEGMKKNFHWSLMWRLLEECHQPHTMLNIQYRMHPEIRAWPSLQYYKNSLVEAESLMKRPNPPKLTQLNSVRPCLFVNVSNQERESNHSYKNVAEANCIVNLLKLLINKNINCNIGVITFYNAQVSLLKEKIKPLANTTAISINTVDSFQGDERDIIIISFVRANFRGQTGFLTDFRRLNVALTRAKFSLIMFGHIKTLEMRNPDIASLLENLRQRNLLMDATNFNFLLRRDSNPFYKTNLCHDFLSTGKCKKGVDCQDAHGKHEISTDPHKDIFISPKAKRLQKLKKLCQNLGYQFQNMALLEEALTRQSTIEEKFTAGYQRNYQRLEFFGDRVVNAFIAEWIYKEMPHLTEGQLHNSHKNLVANKGIALPKIGKNLQLEKYLLRGKGEKKANSKMYADAVEALLGAIFIDESMEKPLKAQNETMKSKSLVERLWAPYFATIGNELACQQPLDSNEFFEVNYYNSEDDFTMIHDDSLYQQPIDLDEISDLDCTRELEPEIPFKKPILPTLFKDTQTTTKLENPDLDVSEHKFRIY